MTLLWDSAFIKMEIVFRNFVPRQLLATWSFLALYFDLLTNEIEGKHAAQTCQAVNLRKQERQPVASALLLNREW